MNRITLIVVVAVTWCLFITEAAHSASFGDMFGGKKKEEARLLLEQKDQECKTIVSIKNQEYQRLEDKHKDAQDTIEGLREKNSTLMEAYEKIVTDQTGIMEQLNRLRRDNQGCEQVKGSFDQMTQESEAFLQENQLLEQDKKILKATLDSLKSHIAGLNTENEKLNVFLKEADEDENVKVKKIRNKVKSELNTLKRQNISLSSENNTLSKLLKEFEKKSQILAARNLEEMNNADILRSELTALETDYAAVQNENRHLAQEASEFPKKFTDLARHNRKLVKETSHMHYNMGVSFIKAKEFKRAIKEFKKVLELEPNDAYANYNLGYIYAEHLVDRPTAIRHFKSYLTYAKDEKDADWVKKYILTWQTWYGKEKLK